MDRTNKLVNQILCGDCQEVMRQIPDNGIDLVVTDPPYVVNYESREGQKIANDNNSRWLLPAFEQIYRVLKADSFCISFYGWNKINRFSYAWKQAGFRPVGHLVWVKDYTSQTGFVGYSHESAYLLAKGDPLKPRIILGDVLEWHYTGNTLHPTQKPVMAILPLIMAFSKQRQIVLDPFAGSGTTLVAAKKLNRKYIGIEIDPKYCKLIEERLKITQTE